MCAMGSLRSRSVVSKSSVNTCLGQLRHSAAKESTLMTIPSSTTGRKSAATNNESPRARRRQSQACSTPYLWLLLLVAFFSGTPLLLASSTLVTYPVPAGVPTSHVFEVKLRTPGSAWQVIECYAPEVNTRAHTRTSMTYFDFSGTVEVAVTLTQGALNTARIRPRSFQVEPAIAGNTLTFTLTRPRNLSIEVNGDTFHNLQLFAGAIDAPPPPQGPDVIYFGPGLHSPGPKLALKSGQTLYLAGGAVLQTSIVCDHVHDVQILGRGILYQAEDGIGVAFSDRVRIHGVIVMNPSHYAVLAGNTTNLSIEGLKSFSSQGWGDGIDIFSSKHVLVDDVFMRNSDDTIAIYGHRWNFAGDVDDVTVQNSVLWPDVAHPIIVGTHGNPSQPETLEHLTFKNIDILQQDEPQIDYQGCIALNASDSNLIQHVRIEDVRIEDITRGQIVNLRVMFNRKYATAPGRGVQDVYLKNLAYTGTHANMSVISGYDDTHAVHDITFENLSINGTVISDHMPGKPPFYKTGDMANILISDHADRILFLTSEEAHQKTLSPAAPKQRQDSHLQIGK